MRTTIHKYAKRIDLFVRKNNVKWDPLIDPSKMLMSPAWQIKLCFIKQLVEALDKNSEAFKYLQNFFLKISEAKIKASIFIGPEIRSCSAPNFLKTYKQKRGQVGIQ